MQDITIKALEYNDLEELSDLASKTYTETFGHSFTKEELETQIKETRSLSYFRSAMKEDTILTAWRNNILVGYIQFGQIKFDTEQISISAKDKAINALYVHSDFQGKGLGRMLMDEAFKHPNLSVAENIFIDVWDENKRAVNFYLNYGFEIVGRCNVIVDDKIIGSDLVLKKKR